MPIIKNPESIGLDSDGKIYVKLVSDLDTINDMIRNTNTYRLRSTDELETFYSTLDETLKHLESQDKYIAEIDVKSKLNLNEITILYNREGKPLKSYGMYRCIDTPAYFVEN